MTKVKICGLSQVDHVLAASKAGADFLGMVFAPSKRQITPEQAKELVDTAIPLWPRPSLVGVFVNTEAKDVRRIAEQCKLDWVQLSGDETWDYCKEIQRPIIKVIHVANRPVIEVLAEIEQGYKIFLQKELICLLDSVVGDYYGGTGQTFDWQVAKEVSVFFPVIVAGGLNAANVGQLIKGAKPWGVDVSSGIETDGVKDVEKIKGFIEAVRQAEAEASQSEPAVEKKADVA